MGDNAVTGRVEEWGQYDPDMKKAYQLRTADGERSERAMRYREAKRIGRPTNCTDFYINEIEAVEDRA